jgi:GT2 family glycosyltransferase
MLKNPSVAVVIVGYQSRDYIEECLTSLYHSSYENYQVIFVDNSPEDGSSAFVRECFPKTIVIENPANLGFASANNIGAHRAKELEAEYIFLLNPDTVTDEGCLSELARNSSASTVCQPLILLHKGKKTNLVNTAGNMVHYLGFSYVGGYKQKVEEFTRPKSISAVSGAAFFAPLDAYLSQGGLDESYFTYHEDTDLSWRLRMTGCRLILVPSARVWHKYSFSKSKRKYFFVERNRLLFMTKCYKLKTLLLILPLAIVIELMMCLFSIIGGWPMEKLKSYGSFFANLPQILKKRSAIQKQRTLTDRNLLPAFSSSLKFEEVSVPGLGVLNFVLTSYWKLISHLI